MRCITKLSIEYDEEFHTLVEAKLERKKKSFFSTYKETNYFDLSQLRSFVGTLLKNLGYKK